MARRYEAYLVRRRSLDDGGRWIEVTHIQSGVKALTTSLPEALDWIAARSARARDESLLSAAGRARGPPAT